MTVSCRTWYNPITPVHRNTKTWPQRRRQFIRKNSRRTKVCTNTLIMYRLWLRRNTHNKIVQLLWSIRPLRRPQRVKWLPLAGVQKRKRRITIRSQIQPPRQRSRNIRRRNIKSISIRTSRGIKQPDREIIGDQAYWVGWEVYGVYRSTYIETKKQRGILSKWAFWTLDEKGHYLSIYLSTHLSICLSIAYRSIDLSYIYTYTYTFIYVYMSWKDQVVITDIIKRRVEW